MEIYELSEKGMYDYLKDLFVNKKEYSSTLPDDNPYGKMVFDQGGDLQEEKPKPEVRKPTREEIIQANVNDILRKVLG